MISLMPQDALFLDFDGTLAELGPDPDAIRLDPATAEALARLAAALDGALVLISGRDLRDLVRRTPDGLWRAGASRARGAGTGRVRACRPRRA